MNSSAANALIRRFGVGLFLFGWLGSGAVLFGQNSRPAASRVNGNQAGKKGASAAADYSKEPYVIEKVLTKAAFAADGTGTTDTEVRAKVQSQAGVRNFSILSLPYGSANEKLKIVSVRVRKPDGTVVETPTNAVRDMPAEITRQAPYYSDLREKQVAVKGLEPGDTLEYEYRDRRKPLTPGQFWYSYDFVKNAIALSEELQLSVPENRPVIVGSGSLKPTVTVESGRRIYTWKTSRFEQGTEDATERARESLDAPPADVQMTSFRNWAEVGEWYRGLAAPRAAPTAEIRAKEQALTKGMTSDAEKLRAIYDYVSLKFRYVGVAFGIGRYQPHPAGEVLSNEYGDCKDKETLLAALLAAAGVKAYPALIHTTHKIDPSVPSPGNFDHVIAAVPQGTGYLWLDTTTGVAPAGYLLPNLRDKEALVIPDRGAPQLVRTPASPPMPMSESFTADAKLNAAGTLDAEMKADLRDDAEVLLRLALRAIPQPRWNDLVQAISYRWGFGGTVSDVATSAVDTTAPALLISYHYTRKNYSSWSEHKIGLPVPQFLFPEAKQTKKTAAKPLELGPPSHHDYAANVTLPAGYTAVLPAAKNLVEDFAEYHSRYSFANGVLHGERHLIVKASKVPVAELGEYKKFAQAVKDDYLALVSLQAKSTSTTANSAYERAQSLYEQGRNAFAQRDLAGAADFFQKAVTADGKFGLGWSGLGAVHMAQGNVDEGLEDLKKAIAVDPKQALSYKMLARAEMLLRRPDDALETWRSLEKVDPNNGDAPANAGAILLFVKRYAEAVAELESAVKRDPTNARLYFDLGAAELHTDQAAKAFGFLAKGLKLDPSAGNLNNVAYELAVANQHLDDALGYAQKAVQQEELKTANLSLDSLRYTDLRQMQALGDFWDTLGWVDFRLGRDAEAEKYLLAAWQLSQDPDMADHLGQLYQREGKRRAAVRYDAFALAAPRTFVAPTYVKGSAGGTSPQLSGDAMPETHRRLVALVKSDSRAVHAVQRARERLGKMRTIRLRKLTTKQTSAEFFVLFAAGPKVTAVKFVSGSEELKAAIQELYSARFDVMFPDAGAEKIVRRGTLDCEPTVPYCEFVLMTPDSVHSIQ